MGTEFKKLKTAVEVVVVDGTMVPFIGRLKFKQHIPGKSPKYRVKLFKLHDLWIYF